VSHPHQGAQGLAGKPEVQQHHVLGAAPSEEEVGGLDIPVDNALLVGRGECLGRAAQQGQGLREAQGLASQTFRQVLALEPLHDQKGLALLGGAMGDVGDDAGVVQLGQQHGLAVEAVSRLRGGGRMQEFERDVLTRVRVDGAVDRAHAAAASQALEAEAASENPTWGKRPRRK
jgi:hypothetical protein